LAPLAAPAANEDAAAPTVKVTLGKRECLADAQPGTPQHHDRCAGSQAVHRVACNAHRGDDLLDGWWVGRITAGPWCAAVDRDETPA
jgi:hypothetical protein